MNKELEILFKLIRIALDCENDYGFPTDTDWREVVRLSYEQKVSVLAADGARKAGLTAKLLQDNNIQKIVSLWLDGDKNVESGFEYYKNVICALAEIFAAHGLKTVILKGIGLSANYPIPSHRGMGDLDICLLNNDNKLAAEEGDRIAREVLGVEPDVTSHHSAFDFNGIHVENHTAMAESFLGMNGEKEYVDHLSEIVTGKLTRSDFSDKVFFPCAEFNALFLMRHTLLHFYSSNGNLRQYCDWATFLMKHSGEVNWAEVNRQWSDSGMKPFADGLNSIMSHKFNLGESVPEHIQDLRAENSLIVNLTEHINYCGHLPQRIRYFYYNRDKLNILTGKHWVYLFFYSFLETFKFRVCRNV